MRRTALFLAFVLAAPAFAAPPPPPPPPPGAPLPPLPDDPPPGVEAWSAQREREILEVVREKAPDQYAELMRLRDANPEQYRHALRRAGHLVQMAQDDPDALARIERMQEVERRIGELAEGYDQLTAAEQKKRRAELEKLAGELFDLRQEQRRATVEELEDRLEGLKAEIADREKDRDQIIDDWLDHRLDPQPGL